ncbi:MAG: M48 family metalloprotease [Pyrinomonadaceae bacterium]
MKNRIFSFLLIWAWLAFAPQSFAQKPPKVPSKIGDALILEFKPPFDRMTIDTDESVLSDRENVLILVGTNTKILDAKGKPLATEAIRAGMKTEIKLEPGLDLTNLIASQIKVKTNPENKAVEVKGYLDKVSDEEAFVDGKTVLLVPNAVIVGGSEWKNKSFSSFKDIPLGSVLDLKGTRRENGKIHATGGQVKPNLITPLEKQLIQLVQKGLVLPPPDKPGAGVQIGGQTFKVVENLELNTYVTKVGYKVIPRYLKNLQDGDPNKILFRFYVLEDDTPNAVAFPDGSVFINTGLLRKLDNEAQLALILGHEIAHVSVEHPRRTLETAQKQAFWMGLAGAVAGAALGQQYGGLIGQIGFGLLSNKFSRDMEDQADRIGLFYTYDAGYDIRESTKIWRKLIGENYRDNSVGVFLYSDHPSLKSRLRNTKRELVTNYRNADFSEVIDGREKYMETVGVFFGWVKPKLKPIVPTPQPVESPTIKPKTKAKPKVNRPKVKKRP